MKNLKKKSLKTSNGITLIALVITIIVLLILAGISISMLSGDNGILQQTTTARTRTIHANVLEQMQLEASAYTVDKTTGNYSNSLIDYLKSKSIISDISGEEDKWLINVTTLLGSNQSMGKGTYPNDVYVLEKQDTSTGNIVNTRVATTIPIKIASTSTNQVTYIVKYYGNTNSENLTLGNLFDDKSQVMADESEKIKKYLMSPDSYDNNNNYIDNDTVGIKVNDLQFLDNDYQYLLYKDGVYNVTWQYDNEDNFIGVTVTKLDVTLDLSKFGVQTIDAEFDVLVTPSTPENLIHGEFTRRMYSDENGNEVTGYRTYDKDGNRIFYSASGVIIEEPLS